VKDESTTTRLLMRPDGQQVLVLRKSHLAVLRGPDSGLKLSIERPRISIGSGTDCQLKLSDPAVSRHHAELVANHDGLHLRDMDSKNGTFISGARIVRAIVQRPVELELGNSLLGLAPTSETIEIPLSLRDSFGTLLGRSPAMRELFATLERVAASDSTILIGGESGTGKELTAQAIHEESARKDGPFVVVDCAALKKELIEAELFGHEKGAFTGADRSRMGAFEAAHGGTIFLDEVGELPLDVQPRLLRFLERKQVRRVGGSASRAVDARVVAATNRDLKEEVRTGRFRQDLFYRLAVIEVELPPLRDRVEDLELLAFHFAEQLVRDPRKVIDAQVLSLLAAYRWPGNVRELRNIIERLVVLPETAMAELGEATGSPKEATTSSDAALLDLPFHEARQRSQDRFERRYLLSQLERAAGVVTHAAKVAQLPRQTFHRLLRRHGLR
jgi:two-component system nitrogen regulation response regulator GlnG